MGDEGLNLDGELRLPIQGREFVVPSVDWPTYLELVKLNDAARTAAAKGEDFDDVPFYELAPKVLGAAFEEMVTARVHPPLITHAAKCAFFHQIGETEVAQLMWGDATGKASVPASGSGSTSTTPTGSTSSESANETKRPASSRATRSRTTSKPRSPRTKVPTPAG
jgi:hypothetical protein